MGAYDSVQDIVKVPSCQTIFFPSFFRQASSKLLDSLTTVFARNSIILY